MPTLTDYRADLDALLATAPDASTWTDALLDEAIRQALEDVNHQLVYETSWTVQTGGNEQDLSSVTAMDEILAVAYPWYDGADWGAFATRWHLIEPTRLYFPDTPPSAGETIRVRYTQLHAIQSLDGAPATTLPDNLRRLFARGAAAHGCLLRVRQLSENPATPKEAISTLLKLADVWMDEFVRGLTRANSRRTVSWPRLGLD